MGLGSSFESLVACNESPIKKYDKKNSVKTKDTLGSNMKPKSFPIYSSNSIKLVKIK